MSDDENGDLFGLHGRDKPGRRRNRPLKVLRSILPSVGRAAAGVKSAADKKARCREKILRGLEKLDRADSDRLPTPEEVGRAGGISSDSVRRHCNGDDTLRRRVKFKEKASREPSDHKALKMQLLAARQVILQQEGEIERLEASYRTLIMTCGILEQRIRPLDPRLADEFQRSVSGAGSGTKPNLRLVTNNDASS
jgi:hypothetical protein